MIKNFLIACILLTVITIALLGFQGEHRQVTAIEFFGDMKRQDKLKFQKPSSFFADGRAARPPVDGTIPMGYDIPGHPIQNSGVPTDDIDSPLGEFSAGTDYLNTGKMGDQWGTGYLRGVPRRDRPGKWNYLKIWFAWYRELSPGQVSPDGRRPDLQYDHARL
jgi:hypothetical protein